MIAIVNVDEDVRATGPHKYQLRINKQVICEFTHNREEPLSVCLRMAARAYEQKLVRRYLSESEVDF